MAWFVRIDGLSDYAEVHALQQALLAQRADDAIDDVVLLLEHRETITVGRARGAMASVLHAGDVPVVPIERGGDATWHGPGQLVAYPILKLEGARADLHRHLRSLEDAVIGCLSGWGLRGQRDARNTGVWLPRHDGDPRKVCSVGIACRRWVTWHGLALNLSPDPGGFRRIRPCGFEPSVMTTVLEALHVEVPIHEAAQALAPWLARALDIPSGPVTVVSTPRDVFDTMGILKNAHFSHT